MDHHPFRLGDPDRVKEVESGPEGWEMLYGSSKAGSAGAFREWESTDGTFY